MINIFTSQIVQKLLIENSKKDDIIKDLYDKIKNIEDKITNI